MNTHNGSSVGLSPNINLPSAARTGITKKLAGFTKPSFLQVTLWKWNPFDGLKIVISRPLHRLDHNSATGGFR